jgi:CRISPR-associated protein Cas1
MNFMSNAVQIELLGFERVADQAQPKDRLSATADGVAEVGSAGLSDAEKAVIQAKALEALREEFPKEKVKGLAPHPAPLPPFPMGEADVIPARMLNQFVYCQRLFYYEFVEGVFVESADTLRGSALHQKVDSGKGDLAAPAGKLNAKTGASHTGNQVAQEGNGNAEGEAPSAAPEAGALPEKDEVIHSRSVQMGSARLGVVAKMDLVEDRGNEVSPVDYKAGAPREGQDGNELWDTDKIQLGLQALILRDNGYVCHEGLIYYRATKQRVRLAITSELEDWILGKIAEARVVMRGSIPGPLVNSPKCAGCSLAPVCLPDETRLLAAESAPPVAESVQLTAPRRLMAARDDARALYLNTPGLRVGCKDEVLQVKERDKVVDEFRMRDVGHVALFGNIQISTQAVQTLCEQEIPITYFSMGGWFYGITRGHGLKNVFLRMEQFRLARDSRTCLALAKRFVNGKIRNHRTMLMRNHVEPPPPIVLKLKRAADDALNAASTEELLGIEGSAASLYFQSFSGMIKSADEAGAPDLENGNGKEEPFQFSFERRNRRPPTDPVNAMLSLAYSLLSKDCALAVLAVGFDPYVGFYHQPRFGRAALGLDLMEEFRPLVAESVVLNCINNRVVTTKDFVRAGEAVNLSPAGRKRFFQTYEQRMNSLLTHPLFDYKVSYRRALELQARLLGKALTGEILEYVPLLTR